MLLKSFQLLMLVAVTATAASAQIDRARADPYSDFTRYFNDTVKYAEQKDRDGALQASDDMAKALNAMFDFSKDAPGNLKDGNLRELGDQAQAFLDAIQDFRNDGSRLQDKLKRTQEDYSSELSSLKSSYDKLKDKFNIIWGNLQLAGKALKAACMQGCIP